MRDKAVETLNTVSGVPLLAGRVGLASAASGWRSVVPGAGVVMAGIVNDERSVCCRDASWVDWWDWNGNGLWVTPLRNEDVDSRIDASRDTPLPYMRAWKDSLKCGLQLVNPMSLLPSVRVRTCHFRSFVTGYH